MRLFRKNSRVSPCDSIPGQPCAAGAGPGAGPGASAGAGPGAGAAAADDDDAGAAGAAAGTGTHKQQLGRLHRAAASADLAWLRRWRWLIKIWGFDRRDRENRTPLHLACAKGHAAVANFLIRQHCQLDPTDSSGRTPLMMAVQFNQVSCVALLLLRGADPNLTDTSGNTALHLAVLFCGVSLVQLLLQHRANPDAENKEGFTPLSLAVSKGRAEIAEFLQKKAAGDQDQSPSEQVAEREAEEEEEEAEHAGDPDEVTVLNTPLWEEALDAAAVEREGSPPAVATKKKRTVMFLLPSSSDAEEKLYKEEEVEEEQEREYIRKEERAAVPTSMEEAMTDDGHQVFCTPLKASTGSLPDVAAKKKKSVMFLLPFSSDAEKETFDEEEKQEEREFIRKEKRTAVPKSLNESDPAFGHHQSTTKKIQRTAAEAIKGSLPDVAARNKKSVRFLGTSSSDAEEKSYKEEEDEEEQEREYIRKEERAAIPTSMEEAMTDDGHQVFCTPLKASTGSLPDVAAKKKKPVIFLMASSSDAEKETFDEEEKQKEREFIRKEKRTAVPKSLNESDPAFGHHQSTTKKIQRTAAEAIKAVAARKKKSVRFLGTSSSDAEEELYKEQEDQVEQEREWSSEEERAAIPTSMKEAITDDGHQDNQTPLKASTGFLPAVAARKKKSVRFLGTSSSDAEKETFDEEEKQEEREFIRKEKRTAVPKTLNESDPAFGHHQSTTKKIQRTAAEAIKGEHSASTFRVSSPAEKGGLKDGTEESGVQEPGPQLQWENSQPPLLHQLLEDVQEQDPIQGRAVPVALGWLHSIYQKLTAASEKSVSLVEERNKNLKAQYAVLKTQVLNYETDKREREAMVRKLQQELAAALKKLCVAEGSLEESTRRCRTLEEANLGLIKELGEAEDKAMVRKLQEELAAALKKLSVAEGSLEESTRRCRTLEEANLGLKKGEAEDKAMVRKLQQELAAALKKLCVAEGSLEVSTRRCRTLEEANLGLKKREAGDKAMVRKLQEELAAALKKLCVAEGSLEESTRRCRTLEEANLGLRKELGKAKTKCQELEKEQLHSEHHIQYWMTTFEERERELREESQKVQDLLSFSLETWARIKQLEQRVQCLSLENTRLEGKMKLQRNWIEALQGDVEASASACQLGSPDNQQRRSTGSCRGATSAADEERA